MHHTSASSFLASGTNLLEVAQETNPQQLKSKLTRRSSFAEALIQRRHDSIAAEDNVNQRIQTAVGSAQFAKARLAIIKLLRGIGGREELNLLTESFKELTQMHHLDEKGLAEALLRPKQLQLSMRTFGPGSALSDEELSLVFPILDDGNTGYVDLEEFIHFGMAATLTAQRISAGTGCHPGTSTYEAAKQAVDKVLSIMPKSVLEYYSGKGEIGKLKEWMAEIDTDGDGSIDPHEFVAAMKRFGVTMTIDECLRMFPVLDIDGDGAFDLDELAHFVKISNRTSELSQRISIACGVDVATPKFQEVKALVLKFMRTIPGREELNDLKQVFDTISMTGNMEKPELQNALHRYNIEFSDEESDLVFSILDIDGDSTVDLHEFSEFIKACSTTTQRIWSGCGFAPGSPQFKLAKEAVSKILNVVPGRTELSTLSKTFRALDVEEVGKFSLANLKQAVKSPELSSKIPPLSDEELALVFAVIDEKKLHAVSMDGFIDFVRVATTLESPLCVDEAPSAFLSDQNTQGTSANIDHERQIATLIRQIHGNDPLQQIFIVAGKGLGDAHVSMLVRSLEANTHARSLHLQYNDITDKGALELATFFKTEAEFPRPTASLVSHINLTCNKLTSVGIEALQHETKRQGGSLRSLSLKGNPGYIVENSLASF